MAKVITFSRRFPAYHPRKKQPTYFVEKIITGLWNLRDALPYHKKKFPLEFLMSLETTRFDPKYHTIRAGQRFKAGEKFSPRVWLERPYNSKQIILADDIEIKKVWNFSIGNGSFKIGERICDGEIESHHELLEQIALNDGLSKEDLLSWFKYPAPFVGQIICWNENINY